MANLIARTLLSLTAACVVGSSLSAQESNPTFREGILLLRQGKRVEALQKFEEVLAADPSHTDAFTLWRETESELWQLMIEQGGEIEKIAKALLQRATVGRRELSRDTDAIAGLVETATSSDQFAARHEAMVQIAAEHGEFAVPALAAILGDTDQDKGQDYAMLALFRIGRPAVQPLIAALASDNEMLRRNAAAALVQIGDPRAAPSFARLAKADSSEAVRFVAQRGLDKLGIPAGASAVDLSVRDANAYLSGAGVRDGDYSEVIWGLSDGALTATDVPAAIYHLELGKQLAHRAVEIDPANAGAESTLARCYLAEIAAIQDAVRSNPDGSSLAGVAEMIPQLEMVAMATGPRVLRRALTDSIAQNQVPVAVSAIRALGKAESRGSLASSPLVAALDNGDARIKYAAALALASASGGGQVPAAGKVVANLGNAVTEIAVRAIKIIDANPLTQKAVEAAGNKRGYWADANGTGVSGIASFYTFPNYDVVVVAETLPDQRPEEVISLVRKRNANTKILMLHTSDEAEEKFGDLVDGFIKGPLNADALIAKADEVAGDIDANRAQATEIAVAAGNALASLARDNVDLSGALTNLAAQLDRDDAVAIPSANAIGEGGNMGSIDALVGALGGEGSTELKVSCANAIGDILARSGDAQFGRFDEMLALAMADDADAAVKSALVTALGKANLAPGERLKLTETLRTIAGGDADGS